MASGKKTKRSNEKNKKNRRRQSSIGVFWLTLLLVVSIGCVILLVSWIFLGEKETEKITVKIEETPIGIHSGSLNTGKDAPSGEPTGDKNDRENFSAGQDDAEKLSGGFDENSRYAALLNDPEQLQAQNAYALTTASPDEITITFAGDLLLDDEYAIMANMKNRSGSNRENYISDAIDAPLLSEMRGADLFVINNEFPYTDRGEPTPDKMFTFRADPKEAELLLDMGADLVSLANNHASDFGEISLLDSMDTLKEIGVPYIGAGRDLEEASRPIYYVTENMKIAILSATQIERMDNPSTKGATENSPGVFRCRNVDKLLQQVELAKQNSDFVIVFIHWGTESTDELDIHQLDQAPRLAEAGADLIVGHHPHVLQGIDWIGDTPVVYSLGNFLFNSKTLDSCLVTATLDTNTCTLKTLRFIPAIQMASRATAPDAAERDRIITYIQSLSPNVTLDSDGYITPKP